MNTTAHPPLANGRSRSVWPQLAAPRRWQSVDVISDLHLHAGDMPTFSAWQNYMATTPADAVFILGDLFEVWVGDDVLEAPSGRSLGFEARCQQVLASAAQRLSLFFMHGNRDFLLGDGYAHGACMTLLSDPTVLTFDAQGWLLTHGDALCLADADYQQFRATVRTAAWRGEFLARPLTERHRIARSLRTQSESIKAAGAPVAEIDRASACDWLRAAGAGNLVHGHTHRPDDEQINDALADASAPLHRWALSDWDANARPPRLQVLRLSLAQQPQRITLPSGF